MALSGWLFLNAPGTVPNIWLALTRLAGFRPFPLIRSLPGHAVPFLAVSLLALASRGSGRAIMGWLGGPSRGEPVRLAVGAGLVALAALGAGLAGLAFPAAAWVAVLAAAGAGCRGLSLPRVRPLPRDEALPALVAAAALAMAIPGALAPDITFDAQMHHLGLPQYFAHGHRISGVPWNMFSNHPALVEMHYLLAFLLSGGPAPAKLVHYSFGLLACAGLLSWARRHLPGSWAWWALVGFALAPEVQVLLVWAYSDLALVAFATLALAEAAAARPDWRLAGVLCGLAAGTKANGIVASAVVAGALGVRGALRTRGGRFLAGALLPALPWGARNLLFSGNPVAPFLPGIFPTLWWGSDNLSSYTADFARLQAEPGPDSALVRLLARPWAVAIRNAGSVDPFGGAGGLLLWLVPPALILGWRNIRVPALLAGGYALLWSLAPRQVRYSVPFWPALAIVAAGGARVLAGDGRWRKPFLWLAGAWVAVALATGVARQQAVTDPLPVLLGGTSRAEYLARHLPDGDRVAQAREWLDANAGGERVLLLVPSGLWLAFGPGAVHQTFYDTPLTERFARESAGSGRLAVRLRQMRLGWTVYQPGSGYPLQLVYGVWRFGRAEAARWRRFWEARAVPYISVSDRVFVHRVGGRAADGRAAAGRATARVPDGLLPGLDEQWLASPVEAFSRAMRGRDRAGAERAEGELRAVASGQGSAAAWEYLGTARFALGDAKGALDAYRKSESLGRHSVACALGRARAAEKAGRKAEADSALRRALELDPESGEAPSTAGRSGEGAKPGR
jgi:hypothetical protein